MHRSRCGCVQGDEWPGHIAAHHLLSSTTLSVVGVAAPFISTESCDALDAAVGRHRGVRGCGRSVNRLEGTTA
jgi:hypothetical protein